MGNYNSEAYKAWYQQNRAEVAKRRKDRNEAVKKAKAAGLPPPPPKPRTLKGKPKSEAEKKTEKQKRNAAYWKKRGGKKIQKKKTAERKSNWARKKVAQKRQQLTEQYNKDFEAKYGK